MENGVTRPQVKVEKLDYTVNTSDNFNTWTKHRTSLRHHEKIESLNNRHRRKRRILHQRHRKHFQSNHRREFLKSEEMPRQTQESCGTPNKQDKKTTTKYSTLICPN